jgi:hypothetical protein
MQGKGPDELLVLFVEQIVSGRLARWSLGQLAQRRLRERAPLENGVYLLRNGNGVGVVGAVIGGFVIGMWLLFWVTGFRVASDSTQRLRQTRFPSWD